MSEKIVTDYMGRPIGRLITVGGTTTVIDYMGRPLGTADASGTRDFMGRPLSPQNIPGILFGKK